jgi:hypothetical protein
MVLRYNSELKQIYREFMNKQDNADENYFCLETKSLIKLIKDTKV